MVLLLLAQGGSLQLDYQRVIDWLDDRIVNRPGRVVGAFLRLTAVFAVGAMQVSTEDYRRDDHPDANQNAEAENANSHVSVHVPERNNEVPGEPPLKARNVAFPVTAGRFLPLSPLVCARRGTPRTESAR